MAELLEWIGFSAGALILVWTWTSVIGTLIVPRQHKDRLSAAAALIAKGIFAVARCPIRTYRRLDTLLAWQAPMTLFIRLGMWIEYVNPIRDHCDGLIQDHAGVLQRSSTGSYFRVAVL